MMVLMENPGMVLHPVDGNAPERLWVEVRKCSKTPLGRPFYTDIILSFEHFPNIDQ